MDAGIWKFEDKENLFDFYADQICKRLSFQQTPARICFHNTAYSRGGMETCITSLVYDRLTSVTLIALVFTACNFSHPSYPHAGY